MRRGASVSVSKAITPAARALAIQASSVAWSRMQW